MPQARNNLWVPDSERLRQAEADTKKLEPCLNAGKMFAGNCPECRSRVIFHCHSCEQIVTGCVCTMKERVAVIKTELTERLFR